MCLDNLIVLGLVGNRAFDTICLGEVLGIKVDNLRLSGLLVVVHNVLNTTLDSNSDFLISNGSSQLGTQIVVGLKNLNISTCCRISQSQLGSISSSDLLTLQEISLSAQIITRQHLEDLDGINLSLNGQSASTGAVELHAVRCALAASSEHTITLKRGRSDVSPIHIQEHLFSGIVHQHQIGNFTVGEICILISHSYFPPVFYQFVLSIVTVRIYRPKRNSSFLRYLIVLPSSVGKTYHVFAQW